jgi:hypothetical protein
MKRKALRVLLVVIMCVVICLLSIFCFEVHQEREYMKECQSWGKTKYWCEQTWLELRMME